MPTKGPLHHKKASGGATTDCEVHAHGARLCFVGVGDRRKKIIDALDAARLTDDELSSPATVWARVQDPFEEIWLEALDPEVGK